MKAQKSLFKWNNNETSKIKQLTVNTQDKCIYNNSNSMAVWITLFNFISRFLCKDRLTYMYNREAVGLFTGVFLFEPSLLAKYVFLFLFEPSLLAKYYEWNTGLYIPYMIIIFIAVATIVQIRLKSNEVLNCSLTVSWAQIYIIYSVLLLAFLVSLQLEHCHSPCPLGVCMQQFPPSPWSLPHQHLYSTGWIIYYFISYVCHMTDIFIYILDKASNCCSRVFCITGTDFPSKCQQLSWPPPPPLFVCMYTWTCIQH